MSRADAPGGKVVRIGGASAFFMDSALAVPQLLRGGNLDYLIFDYLAEGSMAIFGRQQAMDPQAGYGIDFLTVHVGPYLHEIAARGVKVVANAGGVNPAGLAAAIGRMIEEAGLPLRVAHVEGDDLRDRIDALRAAGHRDMFTGAAFPERVISANAYLGALPIAAALANGADIVVTGRVVDSAVVLGPLMHEFGWSPDDHDLMAAGTLAGHLLECGTQVTGGTFTDWRDVPDWENIGYPIGECHADGSLVVTKPEGTGGLVSVGTVAEQLLYEVANPADYIVADVRCDFSDVRLEQVGPDRVRVSGARGRPPTRQYKVCVTYDDGWRGVACQPIIGRDAAEKARRQADAVFARSRALLRGRNLPDFRSAEAVVIGAEESYGAHAAGGAAREVICKMVVDHDERLAVEMFAREQCSAITQMAPGTSINLATQVAPITGTFLFLLDKQEVQARMSFGGISRTIAVPPGADAEPAMCPALPAASMPAGAVSVPLVRLAWGRSGDKGDLFNVAVIARRPEFLPWISAALNAEAVARWYAHLGHGGVEPRVERYEVPGLHALNFVVNDALAGGINFSPRLDPAAKGMAQMLLEVPVPVPPALAAECGVES